MGQLDLHRLRGGRRSSQLEAEHPDLECQVVVRRIFGENGAEEGAVAQRRRRLVGQSVAGGADRALLAFALQETDVSTFGSHKKGLKPGNEILVIEYLFTILEIRH